MNYLFSLVVVFLVFGVVVLSVVFVPYQGVVVLMMVSFICCIFMIMLGRTFAALVIFIVYLGGLVVIFGYCVGVEKSGEVGFSVGVFNGVMGFILMVLVWGLSGGVDGLLVYSSWEGGVCLEVNGGGVFYSDGGLGLLVCSWGLLVVLYSVLIILGGSRVGGLRSF